MVLTEINTLAHPLYPQAMDLYRISFPFHEQRESLSQEQILGNKTYHFSLIEEKGRFLGLVLYWETPAFIYIEHLCILPEMRNKQYGQRALALLAQRQKTLILEIDPPVDELSERRKCFYERCGFVENSFLHIHPPYHSGTSGHNLVIMTHPRQISTDEYNAFYRYLQDYVMDNAFV